MATSRLRRSTFDHARKSLKARLQQSSHGYELTALLQKRRKNGFSKGRDVSAWELRKERDKPAQQRIQILAALMKLRRIACHPVLGGAKESCGSAKQEAFLKLVDELREAGHRILVFSQFVDHLAIARKNLEDKKISYKYLTNTLTVALRRNGES